MANRAPRLHVGVIIKALRFQIEALQKTPVTDDAYGEAAYKIMQLEEQIEALNFRPSAEYMQGWGGNWLATLRSWVQFNFRNGDNVTWGGHEPLNATSAMTSARLEQLAARIAAEAVKDHMGLVAPTKNLHQG